MVERKIKIQGGDTFGLVGPNDSNLQIVENRFDSNIVVRGDVVTVRGEPSEVAQLEKIFKELIFILNKNGNLTTNDVNTVIDLVTVNEEPTLPKNVPSSVARDELDTVVLYSKNQII